MNRHHEEEERTYTQSLKRETQKLPHTRPHEESREKNEKYFSIHIYIDGLSPLILG